MPEPTEVGPTIQALSDDLRAAIIARPFDEFLSLPFGWRSVLEAYEVVDQDGHLTSHGIAVYDALKGN